MGLKRYTKKVAAVVKTVAKAPVDLVLATASGDTRAVKDVLTNTVAAPVNELKAGAGDKLVSATSNVLAAVKQVSTAASKPLFNFRRDLGNWNDPQALFKDQFRDGRNMGRSAEGLMVAVNPLDSTLKKFDQAGIEAGGIGKGLGRIGEKARQNPIATTAIVYTAVAAAGSTAVRSGASWLAGGGAKTAAGYVASGVSAAKTVSSVLTKPGGSDGGDMPQGGPVQQKPSPVPLLVVAGVIAKILLF